ncbi:EmrB/QacA subfamily drug resistance transporter [Jatrophihabitans sp. GAS493]|uniref:MFS transporter n=1 Tax=Jatrophihabitans sp. GAS493 TaxID=1907575 RepID=UPI000BB6E929|nr:MFS transporter [Jatrophihabitans sp. GAS493]SOD71095.1 EmrB/QacA subfamily drug resistance transporter [Jatrophihabitans sp. GAS493]
MTTVSDNQTAPRRARWALLAVALATFMTYLDNNIINVAMPAIQRDLQLSVSGLEWVVSGYILTFAGLLLVGGRLADAFGRKRLFLIGLGIFTIASLAAGLSDSSVTLIAARVVQGLGAALVTPTTLAIISATFTNTKARNAAVGIWSAVGALALAVGPLLGGVLSQHASWGWIFFINVPVGVATLALGAWAITESRESTARGLDLPGLITSALALFTLTYALIEGHDKGWTSVTILGAFALSAVMLVVFIQIERRSAAPMVDVALFTERAFSGGTIALMMWAFGLFGIYFFTSLYLQNVLGFSPTKAGLAFVPMALLMAVSAIVSERVALRFGAHRSTAFAMFLMAAGIASVSMLGESASFLDLMPSFAIIGIGGGLTIPLTTSVLAVMPVEQSGVASALFNASREVAGLLGITVIGAILVARQTTALAQGHSATDAFLTGYRTGLVVAAVLVAAGGVAAWIALRPSTAVTPPSPTEAAELALAG